MANEIATNQSAMITDVETGALLAQAEAHLEQYPCDGYCAALLAPIYLSLGRHDDAERARHIALTLLATAIRAGTLNDVLAAYDAFNGG